MIVLLHGIDKTELQKRKGKGRNKSNLQVCRKEKWRANPISFENEKA